MIGVGLFKNRPTHSSFLGTGIESDSKQPINTSTSVETDL